LSLCQPIVQNQRSINLKSRLERSFFDFRGMILALLVFDNQKYCTLIDSAAITVKEKYRIAVILSNFRNKNGKLSISLYSSIRIYLPTHHTVYRLEYRKIFGSKRRFRCY